MKKFLLLIALAMTFMVTQASEVFEDGYLKYQIDDNGTISVIGLSASGKSQSSIEVLDIGWQSARTIDRIADNAFENCTNIKSVRIGLGCEYIGDRAFYMATNITSVLIPSSVTYVGKEAFVLMTSCDIKFAGPMPPKFGNKAIIELVPGVVRVICNEAFPVTYTYYDGTLKEAGVTLLREPIMGMTYDFFDTAGNKQIGYTAIGSFDSENHGSKIYKVVITACDPFYKTGWDLIPEDRTTVIRHKRIVVGIGRNVFKNSDLRTVNLSKLNHLEYIDESAFEGSTSLESINLGSTVTEIREKAFANTGISSLTLPACLTQYNTTATENCKNFTSYNVDSNHPLYKTYFGLLYSKDNKTLISFPSGLDYSQILEDNRKVWSPEIEKIGWCAFAGVNSIKQVYVPYGVQSVDRPFEHCNQLLAIKLPATVYDYGDKAYFPCHECSSFQAMAVNSRRPHNIYEGGISMPVKTLYVPKGCKSAYESDRKWSKFSEIIEGAFDFTQAGFGTSTTMYSVTSTEPVVIDGVQYDGRAELVLANTNSTAGQTLKVADYILDYVKTKKYAVTRINNSIFYDNQTQPFTLTLGANVDSIYNDAFSVACHGTLTQLNLNTKLKFVGIRAFENCGISNNLIFSYGIETIEEKAFDSNKIQAMMIPGTIKSIGREAFYNNPMKWISLNTSVPFKTYFTNSSSCKLYVPTGAVNQYKNNSYYSTYTISAGACDFTYNNAGLLNTRYHTTILSNEPVTYDGVTYAGTAKYVYSPANAPGVLNTTTFDGGIASTCKVNGVNKDYLIVEYGDSCLYGATDIVTLPLQNSKAVKRIGKYAFQGTNIASVTMPESL
ncbi:MAG: leucine-rich repeat protein, partial [Bacteroidales bacterium]|nr:leucine-rich repeat protein [Candidatus Sodaliphilus fimicaballi]